MSELQNINQAAVAAICKERDDMLAAIQEASNALNETLAECDRLGQEGIRERGRSALAKLQPFITL